MKQNLYHEGKEPRCGHVFGITLFLLIPALSLAQEKPVQPSTTGNAKTSGPCSPAIPGSHNTVIYNGDCVPQDEVKENQILNSRAYEGLGDAFKVAGNLSLEWSKVISTCRFQGNRRFMNGSPPSSVELQIVQEKFHFCILESEKTFDPLWKAKKDQIEKVVDAAKARIEANEEKKLQTINQRNAWKNEFNRTWGTDYTVAMEKADHEPILEELVKNDINTDRFGLLEKYLGDLRAKVGDYPSQ
jgi:hypothetical protein